MPVYPKQTRTQDNVLAANLRSTLNNGPEWGTASSTLATVSDLDGLTAASGTAGSTISDVGASFTQATLNNNFRSLTAKVNTILALLRNLNV